MRKPAFVFLTSSLLLTALSETAFAQCNGDTTVVFGNRLRGKLVCAYVPGQMNNPNERWSEMHFPNGTLGEWGRGSDDRQGSYNPDVGSWRARQNEVTYDYEGSYSWTLYGTDRNTPTVFCDGASVKALIKQADDIPGDTTLNNPCGW